MCGIFCKYIYSVNNTVTSHFQEDANLLKLLQCRGPDISKDIILNINEDDSNSNNTIEMSGHTLWMQGNEPHIQPIDSDKGTLLFNGDLFNTEWVGDSCDTQVLNDRLKSNDVISTLKTLNGPYSFIYLDKIENKLYFCRDRIGRRSLLVYKNEDYFIISSVLSRSYRSAVELPVGKIYSLCLKSNIITEYSWDDSDDINSVNLKNWLPDANCDLLKQNVKFTPSTIDEEDRTFIQLLEKTASENHNQISFLNYMLKESHILNFIDTLIEHLSNSVKYRVSTQPGFCQRCVSRRVKCDTHSSVGVLFSGGLDCTILAALAHRHIPSNESIDLINVAFTKDTDAKFDTPDRITSKQSLEELKSLFPQRTWNFVEVNVHREELYEKQKEIIADLIYPRQTVLDESLGCTLWFGARGMSSEYTSTCRILLTGIGADELFGGYTRHRNEFRRNGWKNLEAELQFDWQRIASRNLARDDRVISYHGRQPRMPYLDEDFINFALNLKPWQKCYPSDECKPGSGDKMILRLSALKLGLSRAAVFQKRAMQFGSRIANKKENGNDISTRLLL